MRILDAYRRADAAARGVAGALAAAELQARFGVTRLALFGSTARDTATSSSDVYVLVAFDGPATSKRYFGVRFYPTSNRNGSMSDPGQREWRFYLTT